MLLGLDIATWIQEGLVDFLLPYARDEFNTPARITMDDFSDLVQNSPCELYPEISRMVRFFDEETAEGYQRQALEAYAAGADGLSIWDSGGMFTPRKWSMIRRLGHKDDLPSFEDGEGSLFQALKIQSIGGYRMDLHSPHMAY